MESQLHRPYGHDQEDPHDAGLRSGEGEQHQHHEKTSVLKKVKAKAKKLKDTITKHGHGGHDEQEEEEHHYHYGDQEDDEGDEDDEVEDDPAIHGSSAYTVAALGSGMHASQGVNLEKPTVVGEDRHGGQVKEPISGSGPTVDRPKASTNIGGIGVSGGSSLEEDVQDAPSNYQTKTVDPSGKGDEEADVAPLVRSFDKMGVSDIPASEGSHDQFASEPNPTATDHGNPVSNPKSYDQSKPEDLPQDTVAGKVSDQAGYLAKVSTVTSVIADKAMSAKNAVASKLGYGGAEGAKAYETGQPEGAEKSAALPNLQEVAAKVTEKVAPVYTKVADAGSSMVSSVKGAMGQGGTPEAGKQAASEMPDKGVSVKEYLSEKLTPGEEDKALSKAISESLRIRKENSAKTAEGESKPKGETTEVVAGEIKGGDDAKGGAITGSLNKGVIDRIRGTVGSWVGKTGVQQSPQGSPGPDVTEGTSIGEVGHTPGVSEDQRKVD